MRRALHLLILTLMTATLTLGTPGAAYAEDHIIERTTSRADPGIIIIGLLAPLLLITVVPMTAAPTMSTTSSLSMIPNKTPQTEEHANAWMNDYIENNRKELLADIALGGGPALADLSAALEIPASERRAFSTRLRRDRHSVRRAMEMPPGLDRGRAMWAVLRGTTQDPTAVALATTGAARR